MTMVPIKSNLCFWTFSHLLSANGLVLQSHLISVESMPSYNNKFPKYENSCLCTLDINATHWHLFCIANYPIIIILMLNLISAFCIAQQRSINSCNALLITQHLHIWTHCYAHCMQYNNVSSHSCPLDPVLHTTTLLTGCKYFLALVISPGQALYYSLIACFTFLTY